MHNQEHSVQHLFINLNNITLDCIHRNCLYKKSLCKLLKNKPVLWRKTEDLVSRSSHQNEAFSSQTIKRKLFKLAKMLAVTNWCKNTAGLFVHVCTEYKTILVYCHNYLLDHKWLPYVERYNMFSIRKSVKDSYKQDVNLH